MNKLVAFGPMQDERPAYPLVIAISENNKIRLLRPQAIGKELDLKIEQIEFDKMVMDKYLQKLQPVEFIDGKWPIIEEDRVDWINPSEFLVLREERAKSLFEQAQNLTKSDPMQSLALLTAAGKILGTNIQELYRKSGSPNI